jgi:hypothetical protein
MLFSKKGISSLQLSYQLGITQKTAWFVLHCIREMLKDKVPQGKGYQDAGGFQPMASKTSGPY